METGTVNDKEIPEELRSSKLLFRDLEKSVDAAFGVVFIFGFIALVFASIPARIRAVIALASETNGTCSTPS